MSELKLSPDDAARILRRVLAQCVRDEDCLIWQGCVRASDGRPQASISPWLGVSLPRLVFQARQGRAPQRRMRVVPECGNRLCLGCLREVSRSTAQLRASEQGAYSHPLAVARRKEGLRKRSRFSDELVAQVRSLPCSAAEAARITGISPSYVRALRAGVVRAPDVGVWAGLQSRK